MSPTTRPYPKIPNPNAISMGERETVIALLQRGATTAAECNEKHGAISDLTTRCQQILEDLVVRDVVRVSPEGVYTLSEGSWDHSDEEVFYRQRLGRVEALARELIAEAPENCPRVPSQTAPTSEWQEYEIGALQFHTARRLRAALEVHEER